MCREMPKRFVEGFGVWPADESGKETVARLIGEKDVMDAEAVLPGAEAEAFG